jgi:hypothetical protein
MSKVADIDCTLHTSSLLRKHQLLVLQEGWGDEATFSYVDWITHKPASRKRIAAFEQEDNK